MRIGIDVDLTVVDTGRSWYEFLRQQSDVKVAGFDEFIETSKEVPYDMSKIFTDLDYDKCVDYWRHEFLYDEMLPVANSVEVLEDLKHNKGYELVFVSTIKGNHHKSKYYFLKKHFPFLDGFIATKEKKYANVHMLIDDRLNVLEKLDRDVIAIQKETIYTQSTDFKPAYSFNDWSEFSKIAYKDF